MQAFIGMNLCAYGNNIVSGSVFNWDYMPKLILFMMLVYQVFDSKIFSILIQHFVYLVFHLFSFRTIPALK